MKGLKSNDISTFLEDIVFLEIEIFKLIFFPKCSPLCTVIAECQMMDSS